MTDSLLNTDGLSVGYHGVPVLQDIALQLHRGEILSLIGPNGSGKTTLLKSVIRQLAPVKGTIYLKGKELEEYSPLGLARELSVLLTERIHPELMTCRDVVAAGRYPHTGAFGVLGDHDRSVLKDVMEQVRITDLADRYFSQCSDGQKQRVMLARALCQEPEVLILDEPTSYLDLRYKLQLLQLLQSLTRTKGLSVLMSLHEVDLASKVSHLIACVRGDRIERFGPPEEVLTPGYIQHLYEVDSGTYDDRTGNLELEAVAGEPQVFVLSGNGKGVPVFRRLQREGVPFAAGVIWKNDLDYPSACALAEKVIGVPAFTGIEPTHISQARMWIDRCESTICAGDPAEWIELAAPLRDLTEYARERKKLITLEVWLKRRSHEL